MQKPKITPFEYYKLSTIIFLMFMAAFSYFPENWGFCVVSNKVLFITNSLLFALSILIVYSNLRAAENQNLNALNLNILGSTVIKLVVLGISVFAYVLLAGEKRNIPSVFVGMGMYAVYSVVDVINKLQLNDLKKKHAQD